MKKISGIITGTAVLIYAFALIYYSKEVSAGVANSLKVCMETILPSLYAFMVVSGFIISSDLYKVISRPFGFAARYIFRIPEEYFSVFLLSCAAGYPVGAKLLTDLYEQNKIPRKTAEKMLGYCYMGGPAFFCGVAGTKIYGSVKIGMIIFFCAAAANVITGFSAGLKVPVPARQKTKDINLSFTLEKFIDSINSGGIGIVKICAAIVFFASITAVLEASGILAFFSGLVCRLSGADKSDCLAVVKSLLEISNISCISAETRFIPVVAALLSFGGMCVIVQTEGVIGGKLSTNVFYLCRVISIFISYFCCKIVINIFDVDKYIQANVPVYIGHRQNSPIPSVFLLIMTILLLSKKYIAKSKIV